MIIRAKVLKSSKRSFECLRLDNKEVVVATSLAEVLKEGHIVVGDKVHITPPQINGESWALTSVEERKNEIFRNLPREQKKKVIASNVDVMLIVVSAGKPQYKRGLVDRYLARSSYWKIPAYVIFNKMDLYEPEHFNIEFESERLKWLDVKTYEISAQNNEYKNKFLDFGIEDLKKDLYQQTAILLGHSGVGKSKLITTLTNGEINLLSGDLGKVGKGAHTTTWAELVRSHDFYLVDSPGIRSMSLNDLTQEELLYCFPDIHEWSTQCRFSSNCAHNEKTLGCFYQSLDSNEYESQLILSRLESYQRILKEISITPDWKKKS